MREGGWLDRKQVGWRVLLLSDRESFRTGHQEALNGMEDAEHEMVLSFPYSDYKLGPLFLTSPSTRHFCSRWRWYIR